MKKMGQIVHGPSKLSMVNLTRALHRTVYGDGRTKYGAIRVLTVL